MPPTVLVADDNLTVQRMASEMLSEEGMDVITVANGMAAIKKLPDVKPLVVVADVDMPGKNGYEVCDFVKSRPELGYVRVLLVVSDSDPLDGGRGAEVRADGVVKKPFDRQAFVSLVVKSLGEAQALCPPPTEPPSTAVEPASPTVEAPVYEEIEHTEILDLNQLETLQEPSPMAAAHPPESAESFQPFEPIESFGPLGPLGSTTQAGPFEHEDETGRFASHEPSAVAVTDLASAPEEVPEFPLVAEPNLEAASEALPAASIEHESNEINSSPVAAADDLAFHPLEEHESLDSPELSGPPIVDWPASFMAPLEGSSLEHADSLEEDIGTGLLESPLPDLAGLASSPAHAPELLAQPVEPQTAMAPLPPLESTSMEEPETPVSETGEASTLPSLAPLPAHLDTALTSDVASAVDVPMQNASECHEDSHLENRQEERGDAQSIETIYAAAPLADDSLELPGAVKPIELPEASHEPESLVASDESGSLEAVPPAIDVLLVSAVIHAVVTRMAPPALSLDAIQHLEQQLASEIMPDLAGKPQQ